MLASNTCMVVQDLSNDTLSSNSCTALTNSLVLPITYEEGRLGEGGGKGGERGKSKEHRCHWGRERREGKREDGEKREQEVSELK